MPPALLASAKAPFISNESTSAVGLFGFQLEMPLMIDVDAKVTYCTPEGPAVENVGPFDANLNVQAGTSAVENFVTALSYFLPVWTDPVNNKEFVPAIHSRFAFAAELLTSARSFPVLEYFAIIPSRYPANFFPAKVSVLLPIA